MADFTAQDKFDKSKNFTQVKFGADSTLLEIELNEMQKIMNEARADITRQIAHSGVLDYVPAIKTRMTSVDALKGEVQVGATDQFSSVNVMNSSFRIREFNAVINGLNLLVYGYGGSSDGENKIILPPPPTFGYREDLAFLEVWFEEITAEKDSSLVDNRLGIETSRRVKLNYRIRTVADVDFSKANTDGFFPFDGVGNTHPFYALGGNTDLSNVTDFYWYKFVNKTLVPTNQTSRYNSLLSNDDIGLYYAGNGSQTAKDLLKTADGYVYAIPLFRVKRRNSGGYSESNPNGARDYITTDSTLSFTDLSGDTTITESLSVSEDFYRKVKVGDNFMGGASNYYKITVVSKDGNNKVSFRRTNGTIKGIGSWALDGGSDRPDGKFANIIDKDDIIDLRHKVSLTGVNYQQLLEENFDKLLRGELQTKDKPVMTKESFGLTPAPLGMVSQLMPTKVLGNDGVERELVNLLGIAGNFKKSFASNADWSTSLVNNFVMNVNKCYLIVYEVFKTGSTSTRNTPTLYPGNFRQSDKSNNNNTVGVKTWKVKPTAEYSNLYYWVHTSNSEVEVGNFAIYEVDQATYDLIDVDPNFTGEELAKKFPYVSSYPNLVENLIHANRITEGFVLNEGNGGLITDTTRWTSDFEEVAPNTSYNFDSYQSGAKKVVWYDVNKVFISASNNFGNEITSPNNAYFAKVSNRLDIGHYLESVLSRSSLRTVGKYVPYGRWLLPTDYANGDTPNRLADFQGALQRKTWGDPQTSEVVTDIIDPVSNSHLPHIATTQATAGQWSVGDTIKVKSSEGMITGALDGDTSGLVKLSQVLDTTNGTVYLEDVSKLSVGDTILFIIFDGSSFSTATNATNFTIESIDVVNKSIKLATVSNMKDNRYTHILETTASTSSPVTTATGLAGNWTGLGTKEATFTVTTAPTTNTAQIKVDYTVIYPAGKGIVNVPSEVLEATVNGERHVKASDNIVRIKANFEGKVPLNRDLNPHQFRYATMTYLGSPLVSPPSEVNNSQAINSVSKVGGDMSSFGSATSIGTDIIHQHIFSFDIIRLIEDKLGTGFFDDCLSMESKINKAKSTVINISADWVGYGTAPSGNRASLGRWHMANSDWILNTSGSSHEFSKANPLKAQTANLGELIDTNGYAHFIAYAGNSDGVTASLICTDYIELTLSINVAETGYDVLIPENPFPVLADDPRRFKEGENMISPSSLTTSVIEASGATKQVTVSRDEYYNNNNVIEDYDYTVVNTDNTSYKGVRILFLGGPNQTYTFSAVLDMMTSTNVQAIGTGVTSSPMKNNGDFICMIKADSDGVVNFVIESTNSQSSFKLSNMMLTPGSKARAFVPYKKNVKRKKKLDFLGKVAGSTFENPHRQAYSNSTSIIPNPTHANAIYDSGTTGWQTAYDASSKLDGTLRSQTVSTAGAYIQNLYEFDLSHLGLSLAELKSAIRRLSLKWTGYGKGDNAGAIGYGSVIKWWNNEFSVWYDNDGKVGNTSNTPSQVGTSHTVENTFKYVTKDQKVYVLVHSTYPASATNASEIYTDYVSLEIELADYVDYVKGNVVKVRKETKELKLQYPKKSHRTGREDVVNLWYKNIPYQGLNIGTPSLVIAEGTPIVTTAGTGGVFNTTNLPHPYKTAIDNLPIGSGLKNSHFTHEILMLRGNITDSNSQALNLGSILGQLGAKFHSRNDGLLNSMQIIGKDLVMTGPILRGRNNVIYKDSGSRPWTYYINFYKQVSNALAVLPFLACNDGKIIMLILTIRTDLNGVVGIFADGREISSIDAFDLTGKPLVKGVN